MGFVFFLWSWFNFTTTNNVVPNVSIQPQELLAMVKPAAPPVQKETVASAIKKGIASFYHDKFEGRKTATGEIFDQDKFTAASNHFKLGTYVKVTNQHNGKSVYVKVNDRMGHPTRMIDLAEIAAKELKFKTKGTAKVIIEKVSAEEGKRQILAQKEDREEQPNQL